MFGGRTLSFNLFGRRFTTPSFQSHPITMIFSPATYLLHHTKIPKRQYLKSLNMFMINAARQCIPCHWCSPSAPTREEWYHRLNTIEYIDTLIQLISTSHETLPKFTATWYEWQHFKSTDAYSVNNG